MLKRYKWDIGVPRMLGRERPSTVQVAQAFHGELAGMMHKGHRYSAIVLSIYILFLGTLMLDTCVLVTEGLPPVALSRTVWLSLFALGLLPTTFATLLWNWGLARVPAARAGVFINFEPIVGTILGVTLLHESLGPAAAVGGALIVGAAIAFSLRPTPQAAS